MVTVNIAQQRVCVSLGVQVVAIPRHAQVAFVHAFVHDDSFSAFGLRLVGGS